MKSCTAMMCLGLGVLSSVSMADPIGYSIKGRFHGWLDGVPTTSTMTLWAMGDSADIHPIPGFPDADTHNNLLVHIELGTNVGTVNGLNRFFVNQNVGGAGFSLNGDTGADFLDVYNTGLKTYHYDYDFVTNWSSMYYVDKINTSFGQVQFSYFELEKFKIDVSPVPEPASMAALAMGAAAFIRRRKHSA